MKRPALHNRQVVVLQMAFRARKVFGTFEKRAPEPDSNPDLCDPSTVIDQLSYQVKWELVIMWVDNNSVDAGYRSILI